MVCWFNSSYFECGSPAGLQKQVDEGVIGDNDKDDEKSYYDNSNATFEDFSYAKQDVHNNTW